jgi:lipoprotein-anchoring transpeptidase ErfK/SrfK
MNLNNPTFSEIVVEAKSALRRGDKPTARQLALKAVQLGPDHEDSWLLLAAVSSPTASINYLKKALEINPQSSRARKGMNWAVRRLRNEPAPSSFNNIQITLIPKENTTRVKHAYTVWLVAAILILISLAAWFGTPALSRAMVSREKAPSFSVIDFTKATRTPTVTSTATATTTSTATFTATPTNTATQTATYTASPEPTNTPTETPTPQPKPKAKKKNKVVQQPDFSVLPAEVSEGERWIDVDLSSQRVYALEGRELQRSFIVSTGTWRTPTVTGLFRIYVKYRFADMTGPGYYLPDVPYVMYFYKGYGLHGTYWHNNFGTPMSHGCVNFSIADAEWLFKFASVGTIVRIHP